jgi:hypothetical protein
MGVTWISYHHQAHEGHEGFVNYLPVNLNFLRLVSSVVGMPIRFPLWLAALYG